MTGNTLASIRRRLNLTQSELANILRVSALQLFAWEHNLQPIPVVTERTMARLNAHGLGFFRPF